MGIIKNLRDNAKEKMKDKAKKEMKKNIRKAILRSLMVTIQTLLPIIGIGIGGLIVLGLIDWLAEIFTAENNPKLMYESLEIEEVSDLIEIRGDESSGYYLDFIEGIDDKLDEVIKKYNKSAEYYPLPEDVNFLKNMLKAEVFTQFPDLKGTIPRRFGGWISRSNNYQKSNTK